MSRNNGLKMIFPAFAIAILVLSISSPAFATPTSKATPATVAGHASPAPAGNGAINLTPGMPTLPGHGKFGNLHTPPAIIINLTKNVKKQVDDVRVKVAQKIAESRIDIILGQLELYEKWVANSGLDNGLKAGIKVIVDNNIAWFRQQVEDIRAADDLATVQMLAGQADQQAATLKVSIKKEAGLLACDALDVRIAMAANASSAIADRIAAQKPRSNDTAIVGQKLADYNAHVAAAGVYSLAAKAAFEGITDADNMDRGFNEGYRQIAQADREMTQAYVDLKGVYLWYLQASRAK